MFTDDGILMLLDAQVEVAARVAYIIRITRITLIFIHNALLVYQFECLIYEVLLIRKKHLVNKALKFSVAFL